MNVDNLRLAKDMKYEALYWALSFEELEKNTFSKKYNNLIVKINSELGLVDFNNKLSIVNGDSSHIDYIGYQDAFDGSYNNFMLSRIELAYELLSNDGFLVINIDEGEVDNLAKLCKDLFYKVKICKWEKLHPYFDKNRNVNPNKMVVKYEHIIICFKSKESKLNNLNQPYLEGDVLKEKEAKVPTIFKCFGTNSSAKDEIEAIFGDRTYFQTPKPLKLLKELVRATTNKDSTVLDFFAGSGTTGHAVIDLNKEDAGNRKYILISNSESNICKDVTLKRIKMLS